MDAGAVRRAFQFACRHGALLDARELAAFHEQIAAGGHAPPNPAAVATRRQGALARAALAILDVEYRTQHIRIADVATRLHVTQWHLSRVLHQTTSQSFLAHLHDRRVTAAGRMLLSSPASTSVKEIAYEAGYASTRDLDRHFRRATGMTPGKYRRWLADIHDDRS